MVMNTKFKIPFDLYLNILWLEETDNKEKGGGDERHSNLVER